MMTALERMNFVLWAQDRYPGFTTDPQQWARAVEAWSKLRG